MQVTDFHVGIGNELGVQRPCCGAQSTTETTSLSGVWWRKWAPIQISSVYIYNSLVLRPSQLSTNLDIHVHTKFISLYR